MSIVIDEVEGEIESENAPQQQPLTSGVNMENNTQRQRKMVAFIERRNWLKQRLATD